MTNNLVTVNAQFTDGGSGFGQGNFLFVASGSLMSSSLVAIVTPVVFGSLDSLGRLWNGVTAGSGVALTASDNFGAGDLTWNVTLDVRGVPHIYVEDVVVNFSNGASQGLFTLLTAAGWTGLVI